MYHRPQSMTFVPRGIWSMKTLALGRRRQRGELVILRWYHREDAKRYERTPRRMFSAASASVITGHGTVTPVSRLRRRFGASESV